MKHQMWWSVSIEHERHDRTTSAICLYSICLHRVSIHRLSFVTCMSLCGCLPWIVFGILVVLQFIYVSMCFYPYPIGLFLSVCHPCPCKTAPRAETAPCNNILTQNTCSLFHLKPKRNSIMTREHSQIESTLLYSTRCAAERGWSNQHTAEPTAQTPEEQHSLDQTMSTDASLHPACVPIQQLGKWVHWKSWLVPKEQS